MKWHNIFLLIITIIIVLSCNGPDTDPNDPEDPAPGFEPPVGVPFLLMDFNSGSEGSEINYITPYKGKLYFRVSTGGFYDRLWMYDGEESVTIVPWGTGIDSSDPEYLVVQNDTLFYRANCSRYLPVVGDSCWKYTGTGEPEEIEISNFSGDAIWYNNKLYFPLYESDSGTELWEYDNQNYPELSVDINPDSSSYPKYLTLYNDKIYFRANGGTNGNELWSFNDTNGALPVEDIRTGSLGSDPGPFIIFNDELYFSAHTDTDGRELWKYNQADGVSQVYDINPSGSSEPSNFCIFNGILYFSATDGESGSELWAFNGTDNPYLASEINDEGSSSPYYLIVYRDQLFFTAYDLTNGYELRKYNGSGETQLVYDLNTEGSSIPAYLSICNDILCFSADDGITGRELWAYYEE